jgi:hypothetical protein
LAYYLAEQFALADQNDTLAAQCRGKFDNLSKKLALSPPLASGEIIDVYGISSIK